MVTTNDSGSDARCSTCVDARPGRTVGVTDFGADTVDVEALAPARRRAVWVGDIGDNRRAARRSASTGSTVDRRRPHRRPRVPPGLPARPRTTPSRWSCDRQGRLYLITKSFTGGTVYRAPLRPSAAGANRLERDGRVLEYATDAALLPDGRHVLVRGLGQRERLHVPGFRRARQLRAAPPAPGRGDLGRPGRRIRLSSEGRASTLRCVQVGAPGGPSPSAARPSGPDPTPATRRQSASALASVADPGRRRRSPDDAKLPWWPGRWRRGRCGRSPACIALGALGIGLGLREAVD